MLIKPFWISPPASAKDDAAGQAIANRMTSQITGLAQAQRNANDGISVAQTAEGALNQVNDNLQRIRELAVQAQNDTNSESDLASIQGEINQRLAEIDRISEQTNFNGVRVLASEQQLSIQVGANDNEAITLNLEKINKEELGLANFSVESSQGSRPELGEKVGYNTQLGDIFQVKDASGDVQNDIFAAKGEDGSLIAVKKVVTGSETAENGGYGAVKFQEVDGDGDNVGGEQLARLNFAAADASDGDYSNGNLIITGKLSNGTVVNTTIELTGTVAADPEEITTTDTGVELAKGGLAQLDEALAKVDNLRSDLGAVQNRFEDAITNLNTNETNLAAARSRIEDADYAVEVANMTRAQILQQAGTSVLAQANQIPQNVLSLLG